MIDVLVDVDGITYRNDTRTFQRITINNTSGQYLQLYKDSEVLVKKEGRCVFSIVGYNGNTKDVLVVSHEPVGLLTLPQKCKEIDVEAFLGITAEQVVIPSGCECIHVRAFANSGIKILVLPDTLTSIDDSVLDNCDEVTIICSEKSYAYSWAEKLGYKIILC